MSMPWMVNRSLVASTLFRSDWALKNANLSCGSGRPTWRYRAAGSGLVETTHAVEIVERSADRTERSSAVCLRLPARQPWALDLSCPGPAAWARQRVTSSRRGANWRRLTGWSRLYDESSHMTGRTWLSTRRGRANMAASIAEPASTGTGLRCQRTQPHHRRRQFQAYHRKRWTLSHQPDANSAMYGAHRHARDQKTHETSETRLPQSGATWPTCPPRTLLSFYLIKIQNGFTFLVLVCPGWPRKEVIKWGVGVLWSYFYTMKTNFLHQCFRLLLESLMYKQRTSFGK